MPLSSRKDLFCETKELQETRNDIETFLKSARRGACGVVYFRLETSSLEHDDVVMVMDGIFSERVMSNLSFNLHLMV